METKQDIVILIKPVTEEEVNLSIAYKRSIGLFSPVLSQSLFQYGKPLLDFLLQKGKTIIFFNQFF